MQTNSEGFKEFLDTWQNNKPYFDMLSNISSLSKLFSESDVPYLDYRITENLFCRYFNAINDSRSCTAYDARIYNTIGIGIKTFILKNDTSIEKIAEFNKLKPEIDNLAGIKLAYKLAEFRNERIDFANNAYNITDTQYHIVGRDKGLLKIFNTPYSKIDLDSIVLDKNKHNTLTFYDNKNYYSFNRSKSVLLQRFSVPKSYKEVAVDILSNPLELLEDLFSKGTVKKATKQTNEFVVLPLFSTRNGEVPEKSGLNQWNAGGRKRKDREVYIPIPADIHRRFPEFFPKRDIPFDLLLPDGEVISAKVCQDGGKALMSNPNTKLGDWLLGKVLNKKEGVVVTRKDLDRVGADSVRVEKLSKDKFAIFFADSSLQYSDFIDL